MSHKIVAILILLTLLFGPCEGQLIDAMREASIAHADSASTGFRIVGNAHGATWRCGGKFDWRGHYIGPYCVQTPVTRTGAYRLYGETYYPATTRSGRLKEWYVRLGSSNWKDSVIER